MSAHRYWRLDLSGTISGPNMGISECEFRDAAGANLCVGGTPFASSEYSAAYPAAEAFNGITTTNGDQWITGTGTTGKLGYDFGTSVAVDHVALVGRHGYLNESPKNITLQFSDDGISYTSVWTDIAWPYGTPRFQVFTTPVQPAPRYWRVRCALSFGSPYFGVSEIRFQASGSGPLDPIMRYAPNTSSGSYNNVTDGSPATIWVSGPTVGSGTAWLGQKFFEGRDVNQVSITARPDGYGTQAGEDLVIEASPDGVTWAEVWTVDGLAAWSAGETRVFTAPGVLPDREFIPASAPGSMVF